MHRGKLFPRVAVSLYIPCFSLIRGLSLFIDLSKEPVLCTTIFSINFFSFTKSLESVSYLPQLFKSHIAFPDIELSGVQHINQT